MTNVNLNLGLLEVAAKTCLMAADPKIDHAYVLLANPVTMLGMIQEIQRLTEVVATLQQQLDMKKAA